MLDVGETRYARLGGQLGLAPGERALTDAERAIRHAELYGGLPPPRGMGLGGEVAGLTTWGDFPRFIWLLLPMFPWEGPPLPRFLPGWPWTW